MALPPIQPTTPLDWRTKIVNPDGTPNNYFIRLWQTVYGNGSNVNTDIAALKAAALQAGSGISITPDGHLLSNPTIAAEVQAILDQISTTQGTVLFRGAADWQALAPGTSGDVLSTNGAAADPAWITPASGGGGALTLIERRVLASPSASEVFSSLGSFEDLIIVVQGRVSDAAAQSINVRANSDTTSANYRFQRVGGANATASASQAAPAPPGFAVGNLPGTGTTANSCGVCEGVIHNYAGTTFFKDCISQTFYKTSTADTNYSIQIIASEWRSTAAITSLTVLPNAGNMIAGTVISLYGRGGTPTIYGTPFETTAVGTGASQGITLPTTGLTEAAVNVYCNGIRFPTAEYSISGTTLTMTSNAAGDDIAITGYMP